MFSFMSEMIASLKKNGKTRTSETYKAALNSFSKFRDSKDIMFDGITPQVMENYELWLRGHGLTPNTTSFYMRILRAVYNRTVDRELTDNRNPFRHVYTGVDKTVKRALPIRPVSQISKLNLSKSPKLDFARNMFMMSFYLRGMSFIDMAFLR